KRKSRRRREPGLRLAFAAVGRMLKRILWNMEQKTYIARWLFPVDVPPLPGGTITICAGKIVAVEPHGHRKADVDLGDVAILPGFVNAHTHLDLTGARGLFPLTPDFTTWLRN